LVAAFLFIRPRLEDALIGIVVVRKKVTFMLKYKGRMIKYFTKGGIRW